VYEQPCLHILNRNLETFSDLQKSFAQLGLNGGSVLIKLSYKKTETPLEEAMKDIGEFFSSVDSVPAGIGSSASQSRQEAEANGALSDAGMPDVTADSAPVQAEAEAQPEPSEEVTSSEGPTAPPIQSDVIATSSQTAPQPESERAISKPPTTGSSTINGISVYHPPTNTTPAAALLTEDPTVFEPSIDHAKSHQANLQQAGRNKRLLSDKELAEIESSKQQSLASVQSVVVRVRYPDQSQIETTVYASETAADLYAKVMDTLAAAPEPFELRYTGVKGHEIIPKSGAKRLVRDLGFKGRVLVTLVWSPEASVQAQRGPSLKEEYRKHATELKVELASQQVQGEAAHKSAMQKVEKKDGKKEPADLETKMKRFLGFAKRG
jgi:tether containing UBX domain for GLUT4